MSASIINFQKVKDALEKLPAVIYMNQLVQTGAMILKFQSKARYKPNLRKVVLN